MDNTSQASRLLAIGDIHGCMSQLLNLVEQVELQESDQLVFLGDYIDRGPESAEVIDYLLGLQELFPQTIFLRGNHEQMLLDFLNGGDPTMFLLNGGTKTLASYQVRGDWPLPERHRTFLESLALFFETEDFIFVHAGLRPGLPLDEQCSEDLLWIRQEFLKSDYHWEKPIVFGHSPRQEPLISDSRIGLDTGCGHGRKLSCCEVRTAGSGRHDRTSLFAATQQISGLSRRRQVHEHHGVRLYNLEGFPFCRPHTTGLKTFLAHRRPD
jgi:serine/threonine protein phosphatase 1